MSVQMVWGFGGVKFAFGAYSKVLDNAYGALTIKQEKDIIKTKTGRLRVNFQGNRAYIKVQILNIGHGTSTAGQMSGLLQMLENARTSGITVYPRFGGGEDWGVSCILISDIDIKDISKNVPVGQSLELEFMSRNYVDMPTHYGDISLAYLVDGAGNNYVDKDGNRYVHAN